MKLLGINSVGVGVRNTLDSTIRSAVLRFGVVLVSFFLAYWLIDTFALSSVARIVVDMESDHDAIAAVYYSSTIGRARFEEDKVRHLIVNAEARKEYHFDLDSKVVRVIRFDPGDSPGVYRLYSVIPKSFYGSIKPIEPFRPDVIIEPGPGTSLVRKDGFLEIRAATNDPYVVFHQEIKAHNPVLLYVAPIIFAALVLTVSAGFQISECSFWTDTVNKKHSGGQNFDALDGLRGLSALFVLATHTGLPGCGSLGHVGVVAFFCLSGFLLSLPYAKNGAVIVSPGNIRGYYLRRFKRIAPMFYFILALTYLFNDRIEIFIRSLLFLQGNSVLWTVLQEVHFYIFLPVVLLINHVVLRNNRLLIAGLLLILGYAFNHGMLSTYEIFGLGQRMVIHAGVFLTGIMMSYFCLSEGVRKSRALNRFCAHPLVGFVLVAVILGIEQLWALSHDGQVRMSAWLLAGNFNYLVGGLIGLLVLAPQSMLGKLFRILPLRIMGTVSYSFYLLHPICLKIVKTIALDYQGHSFSAVESFLFTLAITFVLSTITYTFIERPFLKPKPATVSRMSLSPS